MAKIVGLVINPQDTSLEEEKWFIPSKRHGDMYLPDTIEYINKITTETEQLSFWWAEVSEGELDAEVLFMQLNNKIYCFNDEATWVSEKNECLEYEEISCNGIAYDFILKNYFLHLKFNKDALTEYLKEFSLVLLGMINLEIALQHLTLPEILELITEKTGHIFVSDFKA